jgi:hypothetical protein
VGGVIVAYSGKTSASHLTRGSKRSKRHMHYGAACKLEVKCGRGKTGATMEEEGSLVRKRSDSGDSRRCGGAVGLDGVKG